MPNIADSSIESSDAIWQIAQLSVHSIRRKFVEVNAMSRAQYFWISSVNMHRAGFLPSSLFGIHLASYRNVAKVAAPVR
jgi:hypothetical protein